MAFKNYYPRDLPGNYTHVMQKDKQGNLIRCEGTWDFAHFYPRPQPDPPNPLAPVAQHMIGEARQSSAFSKWFSWMQEGPTHIEWTHVELPTPSYIPMEPWEHSDTYEENVHRAVYFRKLDNTKNDIVVNSLIQRVERLLRKSE